LYLLKLFAYAGTDANANPTADSLTQDYTHCHLLVASIVLGAIYCEHKLEGKDVDGHKQDVTVYRVLIQAY